MAPILHRYKLKHTLQPLFSECKTTGSLCMCFCQIDTTKVVQSCPIKIFPNFV